MTPKKHTRIDGFLLDQEVNKWLANKQSYEDTITVLMGHPWNYDRDQAAWVLEQRKRGQRDT